MERISAEYDGKLRTLFDQNCEKCGNVFWVPKHRTAKFCSKGCAGVSKHVRSELACATCGRPFSRAPSKVANSKSGYTFCSRPCKEDAQRLGGISEIQPDHYGNGSGRHDYRVRALREHGECCSKCGYNENTKMLDVDHIDSDRSNNDLSNLAVLCVWCHALKTRKVPEHDRNTGI